jgi:hypothetical protein
VWGVLSGWMTIQHRTYVKHLSTKYSDGDGEGQIVEGAAVEPWGGEVGGCSQSESCLYFFLISSGLADSSMSRIS